uniref:Pilin n=1 Tax=uncultured Elusimicrobia bacterium TaxID=699876 RepID=A0A650EPB5_9BACT|nr:hypothetical protein Elusimicrob1349_2040 [uncultured Elusimicrobia bacterium]
MNNKGFTLVEILVAVLIVVILVTMAAPMYDKAIEKSRLAEARVTAKKMFDSKVRLMDSMDIDTFNITAPQFGFENLDFAVNCKSSSSTNNHVVRCATKDFMFSINPTGAANGICARRIGSGDTASVNFLYMGELAEDDESVFQCNNGSTADGCEQYGLDSVGSAWCAS